MHSENDHSRIGKFLRLRQHSEAARLRHTDVQQYEVRLQFLDQFESFSAIAGFGDHFDAFNLFG